VVVDFAKRIAGLASEAAHRLEDKGLNCIADAAGIQSRRINLADRPAV
jgi:hypothetical protein